MDAKSREILDKILAKAPASLTKYEKAFLRARRSYLTKEQAKQFANVLKEPKSK